MSTARLIHPTAELYLDGLFCYRQVAEQTNTFLKWRYARLSVLAFYASLEASINRVPDMNLNMSMANKWKTRFNLPSENDEFQRFVNFKDVRIAISHYDGSADATRMMYSELEQYIDEFRQTTHDMLVRNHGEQVITNWENNITPRDYSQAEQ